ncbi:MAG: aldo/keto reductase [Acidimicrobiia bacterium]|nr:aldo/keto reductase [Acidimicrobiia bacterium]
MTPDQVIGQTGVTTTQVAFGTSALGSMPDTYGYEVDEERARATIRAIFAGPANVIDSSRNYGFGRSERRVGEVIAELGGVPDGFVVSTKLDRESDTGRFDADQARHSFEESLRALSLDRVDVLFLHDPEYATDLDEVTGRGGSIDALFGMKADGLADAVGLAMGRLDVMTELVQTHPFDVILNHNRFTLLNRSADSLYSFAHENGMAVWNAAPYAGGVLAKGASTVPRLTYSPADEEALEPVRAIERICADFGVPPGAAALQFSMRDPRISTTVIGVSLPERVATTTEWAEFDIPDELWSELSQLDYDVDDPEANRDYKLG